jgi:putative transposase
VLGLAEDSKQDHASRMVFLRDLKEHGPRGVRLFVSEKCSGLVESLG